MKSKILFLFIVLLSNLLYSQTASLKGKVIDSKTGEPLNGVIVFISYNYTAYTNNDGTYGIKGLHEGKYNVRVSHLGFKSLSEDIILTSVAIKNFSLEPSPIELDEVIVRSNRFDNYLKNSPYSELLVGSSKIEQKPFQSLPDALKTEPGISLISEGAWGTEVSIRGLNRENVVALIDGNRIATSTDVAARFSLVDLSDVERIEVIKGASSSIYGSGATGGIINVVTKSPQFTDKISFNGNLSSGYNSVNNMSVTSGLLVGGGSFWSSKISASYRNAGNIKTPAGELKNSQFEDHSISGNLNFLPMENHEIKLDYQLFKAENVGIPGSSVFPSTAEVRYPFEKRRLVSAAYEIQNISLAFYKLTLKYSNQLIERDVENIPHAVQNIPATATSPAKRVSVLKITPGANHKNNNVELQGNFLLNENNNLVAGIDYWDRSYTGHREKYQLIEALDAQNNVVNTINKIVEEKPLPDSKLKSLGIFVQDEAELVKGKFSVSLGARFDKIDINGDETFNPVYEIVNGVINHSPGGQKTVWNKIDAKNVSYSSNIGLKYSLNNNLDLTLSIGLSFRSPSLEERFQYIDQGSYVRLGNPNLNPERGKSADLGIRYYRTDFKFVSSFFYNYFNDLVAEVPGTFEERNAFIKTNIGQARLYGFDLRIDYNFYRDFIFYTTFSFVKGDDITANGNLPEIPPLNGNFGLKFNFFEQIEADLSSTIFAEQNDIAPGEIETTGYAVFNINVNTHRINIGSIGFRLSAGIENIFDKSYRNHLSTTRGNITVESGRNIYIKLITSLAVGG